MRKRILSGEMDHLSDSDSSSMDNEEKKAQFIQEKHEKQKELQSEIDNILF